MKTYLFIKRLLDVITATLLLIIFLPLFLIVALAIKIDSKGPVFFLQDRLGQGGKVIRIIKFRSMVVDAEKTGSGVYSLENDPRVTRVGRIIRIGIDELPQCLNIVKGQLSFIGPRPPLTYHPWKINEYTERQKKMFSLLPGITGWAQVNGRKTVKWNCRIEMNCWYVENISFVLDMKIFFMTIWKVIRGESNKNTTETAAVHTVIKEHETGEAKI